MIAHNGKCAERLTTPGGRQPSKPVHAILRARFGAELSAPRHGGGIMQLNSIYSLLFELPAGLMPPTVGDAVFVEGER